MAFRAGIFAVRIGESDYIANELGFCAGRAEINLQLELQTAVFFFVLLDPEPDSALSICLNGHCHRKSIFQQLKRFHGHREIGAGGALFPTTTMITKQRIFVPIPDLLVDAFKITAGPREFLRSFRLTCAQRVRCAQDLAVCPGYSVYRGGDVSRG
jgi:hypothetical protein